MITIEKTWIARDIGRAINPVLAIGQVEGSVYMGLGEAVMEEQEFRLGVHKTPSMLDYKSPTSIDMCAVETILVEEPDGSLRSEGGWTRSVVADSAGRLQCRV